ncbi:MAG: methylmalonyl Co-A mutase-associated GTPase MeaB [Candidatus Neomarinimicrobiota bacterium]|nr:methylmalonyl Co-A mutase-associated GTPase MeaB [Candidatus Neomarinimicrobiota bacterium]
MDLIQSIQAQSKLSISKAISLVENETALGDELISDLFQYTGNAFRLGITGPPGAGKSSLTNQLISSFRKENKKVAIIAIDPTSPFSGGAVLGDRIRMTKHYADSNVYVRSMASRGSQGGLANQAEHVGDIFDAAKYDVIIYETVGVGQIELDIMQTTDTVIVVLVPESGDEIQMIKAGLMEIGNIFAINKSDRPGANKLSISLQNLLTSSSIDVGSWQCPVVQTIATEGTGIIQLMENITAHLKFNLKAGQHIVKNDNRYGRQLNAYLDKNFQQKFWNEKRCILFKNEMKKNQEERLSPFLFSKKLLNND